MRGVLRFDKKLLSSITVDELISDTDDWFHTPYDITIDSDGKVIISAINMNQKH